MHIRHRPCRSWPSISPRRLLYIPEEGRIQYRFSGIPIVSFVTALACWGFTLKDWLYSLGLPVSPMDPDPTTKSILIGALIGLFFFIRGVVCYRRAPHYMDYY